MPVELPLQPSIPVYRMSVSLAGEQFRFRARWNAHPDSLTWFLDIADASNNAIRSGLPIVLGTWIGRRVIDPRFPKGMFQATDTSRRGLAPTLDDIGTRVVVYFYTFDELVQLFGAG